MFKNRIPKCPVSFSLIIIPLIINESNEFTCTCMFTHLIAPWLVK